MQCPQCGTRLETIEYEGIKVETCPGCEGEWLDDGELKHVVKTREVLFSEEERRALAAATKITGVKVEDVDRDLRCPNCGGQTDAINYGGDTGIIIDRCTGCRGIWLDRSELEKIQKLVEGWDDGLEDDLKQYGSRLREVAAELDRQDDVKVSRFGFVNSIINGVLDIVC